MAPAGSPGGRRAATGGPDHPRPISPRIERCELQITDAPGEGLARLLEQIDRRRAQHEEAPLALSLPPAGVDEPPQAAEELWRALDLVEDHELVRVLRQVQLGLGQLRQVGLGLEVEIDRRPVLATASASVVLPTCRGPSSATAGTSARAEVRVDWSRRGIMLAIMERCSIFARILPPDEGTGPTAVAPGRRPRMARRPSPPWGSRRKRRRCPRGRLHDRLAAARFAPCLGPHADELAAHGYSSPRKARCWREAKRASNSASDAWWADSIFVTTPTRLANSRCNAIGG